MRGNFRWTAAGTTEWGTHRRHAGQLLSDALNSSIPQIFDTVKEGDSERRVLNTVETEAAKEKLAKIKSAFQSWIWSDPDRTDRLARIYNDTLQQHRARAISTGAICSFPAPLAPFLSMGTRSGRSGASSAPARPISPTRSAPERRSRSPPRSWSRRRLGLINKAMLVVPGHCLAQAAREFLALYPNARILVADETNFVKEKRHRFLSRAATANWDAIIITHSAFKFIAGPLRLRAADDPGRAWSATRTC